MATEPDDRLVQLGRVSKPHGVRGELKIFPYSGDPGGLLRYRELHLALEGEPGRFFSVERARVQGRQVIVALAGIGDRSQAELLQGAEVAVRRGDLPPLADDEFYLDDLEGCLVVTADGEEIGRVAGILATGPNDVLAVRGARGEVLVPLVPEFVVSLEADRLVVDLPDGLVEVNQR